MVFCFECNKPATFMHHVVPKSLGGTKTIPLCDECHPRAHGENGTWKTKELMYEAIKKRKDEGKYIGGQIPYGMTVGDDERLTIHPLEDLYARFMLEQRLQGYTFVEIVQMLKEKGISGRRAIAFRPWSVNKIVTRILEKGGF